MTALNVDGIAFDFPANWKICKYDESAFYRRQFVRVKNGIKAIDVIGVVGRTAWLIEVKNYRIHVRTKPKELDEEVAAKVCDTLAALLPIKVNAASDEEREFAQQVLACNRIRVVLHLEQPAKHSRLRPRAIDPASVLQKLKGRIKAIDPHPLVVETINMRGLSFSARWE